MPPTDQVLLAFEVQLQHPTLKEGLVARLAQDVRYVQPTMRFSYSEQIRR